MNDSDLKPDLGFYFLETYGKKPNHHFYEIKFNDIIHVDHELYSFTSYVTIKEKEYAASFDFDIKALKELLIQIKDEDFKFYLSSKLVKEYSGPEKAAFYETPYNVDIEAKLGEPVKSQYETFVPLVVKKFSNLKR